MAGIVCSATGMGTLHRPNPVANRVTVNDFGFQVW